jgi:hypothetical protein
MRAMWVITMLDDCASFKASDTRWQQASSVAALLVPFLLGSCFTQLGTLSSTHTRSDRLSVRRTEVDHQRDIPWCAPCTLAVTVTGNAKATVHSQLGQEDVTISSQVRSLPSVCMWLLLGVSWLLSGCIMAPAGCMMECSGNDVMDQSFMKHCKVKSWPQSSS